MMNPKFYGDKLVKVRNRYLLDKETILHDVNLAAAWCDRLLLLADGRLVADGPPADVLTAATLESVYRVPVRVVAYPGGATDSRTDPTGGLQATEDGANGDARARLLVLFEPGPAPREG